MCSLEWSAIERAKYTAVSITTINSFFEILLTTSIRMLGRDGSCIIIALLSRRITRRRVTGKQARPAFSSITYLVHYRLEIAVT